MPVECAQPTKDPEVNIALEEQQKAIEHLLLTSDRVWDKVRPALRDEPTQGNEAKTLKTQSSVPLVADLEDKTRKIQEATSRLTRLVGLCEL